jgi:hypothetical protein
MLEKSFGLFFFLKQPKEELDLYEHGQGFMTQ